MEILRVALTAVGTVLVLLLLTKLMGYRQMSQLSMFDYINGITIGSIAAETAISPPGEIAVPLTAMVVFALVTLLISFLTDKSLTLRRAITGTPVVLYEKGRLYINSLKKAKIDMGELLAQCRIAGWFDLSELRAIVLEPNGMLSFLPMAEKRPLTPKDAGLSPGEASLPAVIITDGRVMRENLSGAGRNEQWLKNELEARGIKSAREVLFATLDGSGAFTVYRYEQRPRHTVLD